MAQKKAKKLKEKSVINSLLLKLVSIALLVCCTVISISNEYERAQKNEELEAINQKINDYKAENAELQQNLESNDMTSYIERVALEDFNYAYPDEQRFYDTSRN